MSQKSIEMDTWNDYLLKKLKGSCFPYAHTVDKCYSNRQFQIFEILVGETIRLLYPEYSWHTTPAQKDGGIDFWGEREEQPMPEPFRRPPLVIYGQVKRQKGSYRQEKMLSANEKMIRYYLKTDLQKRSLYQLIHVISCDKAFSKDIPQQVEYKDNLVYVVTTIDAQDLFRIWANNPGFLKQILPDQPLYLQKNCFLDRIVSKYKDSQPPFEVAVTVPSHVFYGRPFTVSVSITSKQYFPKRLIVSWLPNDQSNVYLITPQGLLPQSGCNGYSVFLIHRYKLLLQYKIAALGTHNLGVLRLQSDFGDSVSNIPLGTTEVKPSYAPYYFELPNQTAEQQIYQDLDNEQSILSFYSVVGEGGIGKSTLLKEVSNYTANHGYHNIIVEHPCDMTDETDFWLNLFRQLMGAPDAELSLCDVAIQELRDMLGPYYQDAWTEALQALFHSGSLQYSGALMECWLCMSILAAERRPLFFWLSNLHWCSAGVIDLLWRYLKNLQRNQQFFNNKVMIVLEGRTEETLNIDKTAMIPFEWLKFQKSPILREIRLQKWSTDYCRQYIDALLWRDELDTWGQEQCRQIRQFLIRHGNGSPMHIHELIRSLIQQGNVMYRQDGRLSVISSVVAVPLDGMLLDLIQARIAYYRQMRPELTDILVLAAHLGDWPAFQQYVYSFQRNCDYCLDELFNEMGVANLDFDTGALVFVHEHYKTVFQKLPLSSDQSVDNCLYWAKSVDVPMPLHIRCRLQLLQKSVDYKAISQHLLNGLQAETEDLVRFDMLQMLRHIPQEILESVGMPMHRLYRLLESACMGMGSWETAESYVLALKRMEGNSPAYEIDALFARKSLSNNYSFRMKFDCAKEECEEAVNELEKYLKNPPSMSAEERKTLIRELCMLKNRLSIIYYLCGRHEDAVTTDDEALKCAKAEGDLYVKYHIQYEQGLRELRSNPELGLEMIKDAYQRLPQVEELPGTQELDLVRADYRMAQLKVASLKGHWGNKLLSEVKRDATEACQRLSNKRERVESILYHAIDGMVSVIEGHLQEALRRFQSAAEIAYRASITHMVWKMHLNIAQCYCLMLRECASQSTEEYRQNIHFHAKEAIAILERALKENPLTHNTFQLVLEYPLAVAHRISDNAFPPNLKGLPTDYCGIQIGYQGYAFFILD